MTFDERTRPIAELRNVSKAFRHEQTGTVTLALQDVSIEVKVGEVASLVGPSGCGKTTALNLIAGFEAPSSGEALVNGKPVSRPGADRGVVFQEPALFHWLTVAENIAFGPRIQGRERSEYAPLVQEMIKRVGLGSFEDHFPDALSGGMKQRVSIARILINRPKILLLDEPFAALDAQTRLIMQEWLLEVLREHAMAALFITHDIDEAVFVADRSYVMGVKPGRIKFALEIPLARPRSRRLLTSPDFNQIKGQILEAISEESVKAFEAYRTRG